MCLFCVIVRDLQAFNISFCIKMTGRSVLYTRRGARMPGILRRLARGYIYIMTVKRIILSALLYSKYFKVKFYFFERIYRALAIQVF